MAHIYLLFFTLIIHASAFGDMRDCGDADVWDIKGKSIEECQAGIDKFKKKCEDDSTMGQVAAEFANQKCIKPIMDKELDKRLLAIKKTHPDQFKNEMSLQKDFNTAYASACDEYYNSCLGTENRIIRAHCYYDSVKWRALQAQQVNSNKLIFKKSTHAPIPDRLKNIREISSFAEKICNMPQEVFKDTKSETCKEDARDELIAQFGGGCDE